MSIPFTSPSSLGALISTHSISKSSRATMTIIGVIYGPMLCGMISASIAISVSSIQESDGLFQAIFLPLCCTGMFFAPGAIILYQQWWKGVFNVAFYERGFAVNTRNGVTEVPWDQVDAVWLEWGHSGNSRISSGTNRTYAFRTRSGLEFRLRNNLEGFNEFEGKFYKPASIAVTQNQMNDLQSGKPAMTYGIGISREGMTYGRKSIRWVEVEAIRADKTRLLIKQNGQWKVWEIFAFRIPEDVMDMAGRFTKVE